MSGGAGFNAAFTVPPFQDRQLKNSAVHTVLDPRDVIGDSTASYAGTSKPFHDANPKVYQALVNAITEASGLIMADKKTATGYFIEDTKTRIDPEEVLKIVSGSGVSYNATPLASVKWADFIFRVGLIKVQEKSWKDMFFQEIHGLSAS